MKPNPDPNPNFSPNPNPASEDGRPSLYVNTESGGSSPGRSRLAESGVGPSLATVHSPGGRRSIHISAENMDRTENTDSPGGPRSIRNPIRNPTYKPSGQASLLHLSTYAWHYVRYNKASFSVFLKKGGEEISSIPAPTNIGLLQHGKNDAGGSSLLSPLPPPGRSNGTFQMPPSVAR